MSEPEDPKETWKRTNPFTYGLVLGFLGCGALSAVVQNTSGTSGFFSCDETEPTLTTEHSGCLVSGGVVRDLYLGNTDINDHGLAQLTSLTDLHELDLQYCENVSDAGMKHIAALSNLRILYLAYTQVSDDGLLLLKSLHNLEQIYTEGSRISPAGITTLKQSIPGLEVKFLSEDNE